MNKDTRARVTDILLILMMVLPFVAVMALKVLTTPHSDEISISGALIYFTIPMPLMDLPITASQFNSLAVMISIFASIPLSARYFRRMLG